VSDLSKVASLLALQGREGFFEVNAINGSTWLTARNLRRCLPPLESLTWELEPQINAVALKRAGRYLERLPSSLLWVRTETGKSASRLRTFHPRPHLVIREGSTVRYVAFWALEDPLSGEWLDRANRRIAHHLAAPKKHCGDGFRFVLPGTILRADRARPLPVELVSYEPGLVTAREVVGRLREAPDPDAWRNAPVRERV